MLVVMSWLRLVLFVVLVVVSVRLLVRLLWFGFLFDAPVGGSGWHFVGCASLFCEGFGSPLFPLLNLIGCLVPTAFFLFFCVVFLL